MRQVLIVVDMQESFGDKGELPVAGAESLVSVINQLIASGDFYKVVFTKDSHPGDHCSFNVQGGEWPSHCVVGTSGWEFILGLNVDNATIVKKAQDKNTEAYSGFDGVDSGGSSLKELLDAAGVKKVFICGVATDYCVKATALAAIKLGYEVYLLLFACKAVDLDGGLLAVEEMKKAGVTIINDLPADQS